MPSSPARTLCSVQRLGLIDYEEAWDEQRRLVELCRDGGLARLLLLEHSPTYTFGVRGRQEHLLLAEDALADVGAAVYRVDRGGDVTFHGPGQLVGYPILDLRRWGQGPSWYVRSLEAVIIQALAAFGIDARREAGRPGVWVGEAKIAAIGVRVSRGITSHGFALNVDPDLGYFSHIVPCGLPDADVTSMAEVLRKRAYDSDSHLSPADRAYPSSASRALARRRQAEACPTGTIREPLLRRGRPSGLSCPENQRETIEGVPSMEAVIDAVVDAFGRVFEIEMTETDRRGDRLVALTASTTP